MWIAVNAPVTTRVDDGYDSCTPTYDWPPVYEPLSVPTALNADCVSREQT